MDSIETKITFVALIGRSGRAMNFLVINDLYLLRGLVQSVATRAASSVTTSENLP